MAQNEKQKIGQWGEDKAVEYLKSKRYKILQRNYKTKWGEIDIVAQDKKTIVFAEVKTLKDNPFISPEDHIDERKKRQLAKMAQIYLSDKKIPLQSDIRIDIVTIAFNNGAKIIKHFKNEIEDC
jgi:putative endonuclease